MSKKGRATRMYGTYKGETWRDEQGMTLRRCTTCGVVKELAVDYHRNGVDQTGGVRYRDECKQCYNAKRKENRVSNKHAQFVGHQRTRGEEDINYTYTEWRETVIYFGGVCSYCGRTLRRGETLTRDHLLAVSKGGKTEQANIVCSCGSCNSSKGNKDWREWFMAQSFFSQERMNKIFAWRQIIKLAGGGDTDD